MRTNTRIIVCLIGLMFVLLPMVNGFSWEPTPPVTSIFFDAETGIITLIAYDTPINHGVGVNATYYKLDGGPTQTYTEPFFIGEGTHTVEYWSVDKLGYEEAHCSATYFVDITPPTVEIVWPSPGLWFLGNPLLSFGDKAICIGKVNIEAEANDGTGSGVSRVFFNIGNDSGYDDSAPYEYWFRGMCFGDLIITVYAEDNNGLLSDPDEITITCFSLGIL